MDEVLNEEEELLQWVVLLYNRWHLLSTSCMSAGYITILRERTIIIPILHIKRPKHRMVEKLSKITYLESDVPGFEKCQSSIWIQRPVYSPRCSKRAGEREGSDVYTVEFSKSVFLK